MANDIQTLKDAPGVIAAMAAKMLADKVQFCKTIEKADKSDVDAISEKLDSKADKDSVVEYKESGEGRKTIQLDYF